MTIKMVIPVNNRRIASLCTLKIIGSDWRINALIQKHRLNQIHGTRKNNVRPKCVPCGGSSQKNILRSNCFISISLYLYEQISKLNVAWLFSLIRGGMPFFYSVLIFVVLKHNPCQVVFSTRRYAISHVGVHFLHTCLTFFVYLVSF